MRKLRERFKAQVRARGGQQAYALMKTAGRLARETSAMVRASTSRLEAANWRREPGLVLRRGVAYALAEPTLDRVLCDNNYLWVTEALDEAGISWWWVDSPRSPARRVIGVWDSSRDAIQTQLRQAAQRDAVGASLRIARAQARSRHVPMRGNWTRAVEDASVLCVAKFETDSRNVRWRGMAFACEVEFWQKDAAGNVVAPRENRAAAQIDAASAMLVPAERGGRTVDMPAVFAERMVDDVEFSIDAVYTWVDGDDPVWQGKKAKFSGAEVTHAEATHEARFRSRDELKYSLRSLDDYAPWIRKVFIVTDGQVPAWLDTSNPRVQIVDHKEIMPHEALPVFNSNAIISCLQNIPGLSEHFIYLNDDVMLGRPLVPQNFFLGSGIALVSASNNRRPFGAPSVSVEPHLNLTRNIRDTLRGGTGIIPSRAIKHTPHPLIRSVLKEQREVFAEAYDRTVKHRFRHHEDIVGDQLHHYYAQIKGRAVPSRLTYTYINVLDDTYAPVLGDLLARRHRDAFCLNDAPVEGARPIDPTRIRQFMQNYFPAASQYERSRESF